MEVPDTTPTIDAMPVDAIAAENYQRNLEVRERDIALTRGDLNEFGVSIADLNRKLERLEQITEKWKGRGLDFTT